MDGVVTSVVLLAWAAGLAYAFRNRARIARWLNTPYYAEDDRRLKLTRSIEDCERELAKMDELEAKIKADTENKVS